MLRFLRYAAIALGLFAAMYALLVRPRQLRWGATNEEVDRFLPGDELVPDPIYETTHAITIDASMEDIWPWLVQIGQGRGGFYSYDWLENLFRLDIHNADQVMPEHQDLKVGDIVSLAPDNTVPLMVAVLDPPRALVLRTGLPDAELEPGDYLKGEIAATWAYILVPVNEAKTRLIVRWRSTWEPGKLASLLNVAMLEPAHFIMERKMLLGIKERAEAA